MSSYKSNVFIIIKRVNPTFVKSPCKFFVQSRVGSLHCSSPFRELSVSEISVLFITIAWGALVVSPRGSVGIATGLELISPLIWKIRKYPFQEMKYLFLFFLLPEIFCLPYRPGDKHHRELSTRNQFFVIWWKALCAI